MKKITISSIAVVALLAGIYSSTVRAEDSQIWTYKVVSVHPKAAEHRLNSLAKQGWEFVTVVQDLSLGDTMWLYLRRGRKADRIELPFVNDAEVIGVWKSVGFVNSMEEFDPTKKKQPGKLLLKQLTFQPNGKTDHPPWHWTRGVVISPDAVTASKYVLKGVGDRTYLFLEWKSGDYTIRWEKPAYYVLVKQD